MLIFRGVYRISGCAVCASEFGGHAPHLHELFPPGEKLSFSWEGVFLVDECSGISSLWDAIAAEKGSCDVSENHCDLDTPKVLHNT